MVVTKWALVRSLLRPKLAQKLADEANKERTGSTPEHNHEDHDDDEEDDVDHEQEMASKGQQERQEKEKDERQEINDKTEKEKEHYRLKLLEVEQENEKLKAQNKVDERVAEEAGSPVPSGKPGREEADSGEHRGPSPGKESQDVEYGFDPFYGKPWGTEVPKVRPGVGDASETPPASGPTRRRPLSRSRVLASRKKRWNQKRGGGPDFRFDYMPNSLSLDDAGEAVSAPPMSLGRRTAEDPRVSRSAATVGDMVMEEKEMEKQQQVKEAGRGSEAAKEGGSSRDLGGSIAADTRGGGGLKVPAEEHLRTVESAAAVSPSGAMDAAAAADEEVALAGEGTAKEQRETEVAGVSLMHGLVGVSAIAAVADGGKAGNVDAADEGGKRPLDEVPVATTDVSGEVEAFEYVDHEQSAAHANDDKGESSSTEGEIGSGSAAAEPDLEHAAASSSVVADGAAGGSSVDGSTDDSGAPCVEDDVSAETVVAVETKGEDPDYLLPAVDEAEATESSSEQLASSPGDVAKEAAAEQGVAESGSDGEQTRGSGDMSTAAGAGAETTSLETVDARWGAA
ncbi:unnamed protein product [Ectocarpus sp. CCAP 1310/34]|nr:unnamed protein product [Ectocarpus sp. CCAP 1310/34]